MKKILIILSSITASSIAPGAVSCGINFEINHDVFHPGNQIVNLKDCQSLVSKNDLTYSFLTVTKQEVRFKIFTRLKYSIRDLSENDYDVVFQNQNGDQVEQINIVNDYEVVLNAKKESQLLTGSLTLNLSVVDDRTNIGQINYEEKNWDLSSRNKVADLFLKFETQIYLAVQNAGYQLGDFLEITIKHNDQVYTKADEDSQEVLDVTDHYLLSASTLADNANNRYITGTLAELKIFASDERRSVQELTNKLFVDYHPNNLSDNGKTLYQQIRNLINNHYTLDSTSQSDFDLLISSQGVELGNDESKLTSLSYEITIDASKSRYLKDVNSELKITIIDKVIHLDQLTIDSTAIKLDVATQARVLKTKIFEQISLAANNYPAVEKYLIVKLIQNGTVITDDQQYLEAGEVQINVEIDQTVDLQPFGGSLNLNLSVLDNRIDLKNLTIAKAIKNSIFTRRYSVLDNFGDLKTSILTIIQQTRKETSPYISQNLTLNDLKITLDGYDKDEEQLKESTSGIPLKIQASETSRYIKNDLESLKININFARIKGFINVFPKSFTEFVDYDNHNQLHVLSQIDATTVGVYEQEKLKYQFNYLPKINTILDYKVSVDGKHDLWVVQTKINDSNLQIDYYIDNQRIFTTEFEASAIIASINKNSHFLYLRLDLTDDHQGIGSLYRVNLDDTMNQVDLSQVSDPDQPFAIDMIRSWGFGQEFIQSKNKIYLIDERIYSVKPMIKEYDLSHDYFFDYTDHQISELKEDGLYVDGQLIKSVQPNSNLLDKIDNYNNKFISNFAIDENNNYYYLHRDVAQGIYSVVKNQEVVLTISDLTALYQSLKVSPTGIWELTVGTKIYTNERKES